MILITGANGNLGRGIIDYLKVKTPSLEIAALVRSYEKGGFLIQKGVKLKIGDYFNFKSLRKAFKGIEKLIFISSGTIEDRINQHINVARAAEECGVGHIFYTSSLKTKPDAKFTPAADHYNTEQIIKTTGIKYTFFRHTFYMEILPLLLGNALNDGNIVYPAGNTGINLASRMDMAEAIANAVISGEHPNRTYEITSTRSWNFTDIAQMLTEASGRKTVYTPVSIRDYREGLVKAGLPEPVVAMSMFIAESIAAGEFDFTDTALENLLGRKPVELKSFITGLIKNP